MTMGIPLQTLAQTGCLLLLLAASALYSGVDGDKRGCQAFHEGKFLYYRASGELIHHIVRTKTQQTSTLGAYRQVEGIRWIDDCTLEFTFLETSDPEYERNIGLTLIERIVQVDYPNATARICAAESDCSEYIYKKQD